MALTFVNRGTTQNKASADPLTVDCSGTIAVGDLIIIAASFDPVTAFVSVSDDVSGSLNRFVKLLDVRNNNGVYAAIWVGVCATAMTASDNFIIDWSTGHIPAAVGVSVTIVQRHTTSAGWKWVTGLQQLSDTGNGNSFAIASYTSSPELSTNDSFIFGVVGWEHNTTVFNAGTGFTEGQGVGTSGGAADSNQRSFVQWRTIAASTTYDANGDFGSNTADYAVGFREFRNTNEFLVGTIALAVWTIPKATGTITGLRVQSTFSGTATGTGTLAGYRIRSTFSKIATGTGTLVARLQATMSGAATSTGTMSGFSVGGGTTNASGEGLATSSGSMAANIYSAFTKIAAGIATAAVLLSTPFTATAAGTGTADPQIRSTFGNITAFGVGTSSNGVIGTTLSASGNSSGSMAVQLRSTFETFGFAETASYAQILAAGTGAATSICTTNVVLRSTLQKTASSSASAVVEVRSSFLGQGVGAGTLTTGGFVTAALVGQATGTASLSVRLGSSFTKTAGGTGSLAPRLFVACSGLSIGTGTLGPYTLSCRASGLATSQGTLGPYRIGSIFAKTAIGNGTLAARLRTMFSGTGNGSGSFAGTLRTTLSKTAVGTGAAACRIQSTFSKTATGTGVLNTTVTVTLSGALSATPGISNSAFAVSFALTGADSATGSVATAALPVARRFTCSFTGATSSLSALLLATKPISGSISGTASLDGLVGLTRPLSGSLSGSLSLPTSLIGKAVPLVGDLTAALTINTPELAIQQGVFIELSSTLSATFSLSNPAIGTVQYPRSPPDRTIPIPADDRDIEHEA